MSPTALIARREIRARLQQRGFRLGVLAVVVLAVVGACLPALLRGHSGPAHYDVALGADVPGLAAALQTTAQQRDVKITTQHTTAARARDEVRVGRWDAAILPDKQLVVRDQDASIVAIVQQAYQLAGVLDNLHAAGLSPAAAHHALTVRPLQVTATKPPSNTQRQALAIIAVILLFSQLAIYCTWVGVGVVEEKASRVVELLLATVRPVQLLVGKLLGIGLLATGQVVLLAGGALLAATASGSLTIPLSGLATLAVAFVGFLLGYALFAGLAAALASTVSRQEEVSGVLAPVSVALVVCYGLSYTVVGKPDSGFARAISIVPPFSALTMPVRIAHGSVPALDLVLAALLLAAASALIVLAAARIYRASVLLTGTRVSLRRAWRAEAVGAELS